MNYFLGILWSVTLYIMYIHTYIKLIVIHLVTHISYGIIKIYLAAVKQFPYWVWLFPASWVYAPPFQNPPWNLNSLLVLQGGLTFPLPFWMETIKTVLVNSKNKLLKENIVSNNVLIPYSPSLCSWQDIYILLPRDNREFNPFTPKSDTYRFYSV